MRKVRKKKQMRGGRERQKETDKKRKYHTQRETNEKSMKKESKMRG